MDNTKKYFAVILIAVLMASGCLLVPQDRGDNNINGSAKLDDWKYDSTQASSDRSKGWVGLSNI